MLRQDQHTITIDDGLDFLVWAREKGPYTADRRTLA
jgi:hypothetical protein